MATTPRDRFLRTLLGDPGGRVPYHDREIRDDVVRRWSQEGLPPATSVEDYFELDPWELLGPREEPTLQLGPVPEFSGRLQSPADFERLARAYDPGAGDRYPADWDDRVRRWQSRDHPLGIGVWRGMLLTLGVSDSSSLHDALYALYDFPRHIDAVMQQVGDATLATIERALVEVKFDYAVVAEPIASWHGPVVGPDAYRRFVLPVVKRLVDRLRTAGIDIVILDTHGAIQPMLPLAIEAGVDTFWVGSARAAGIDYRDLRRRFGRELRLIGGLDVRTLEQDARAIEQEIRTVARPLLEQGRYVPMVDERIRPNVPFESYRCYRRLVRELIDP